MNYVLTGSLGNVSKPLAEKLIAAGHVVTVVSSNAERIESIIAMGAKPAIGSVEDIVFLTKTFKGADAVYTMIPPYFQAVNWKKHIAFIGQNYASAIKFSRVRNVVNLSSIGAHMAEGCGPVSGLHFVEQVLNDLEYVNVIHLRAGIFYLNYLANIEMIKERGVIGSNYGGKSLLTLVHPDDIADAAAEELQDLSSKGKYIRYVASDEKTADELAATLGKAIGKPDLRWVEFKDEEIMAAMAQTGFPEEIVANYTEMGTAMRSGEMGAHYKENRPIQFGKTKLEDFAPYYAAVYAQPQSVGIPPE